MMSILQWARWLSLATLVVLGAASSGCRAGSVKTIPSAACGSSIEDLGWIAGRWQTRSGQADIEEHWTPPAGNSMLGVGRAVAGDKMVFFEYLRMEARPDGIYYVAQPMARSSVDFKMVRCQVGQISEVLFENPAHDHPKRILYRRGEDGSLSARIEGEEEGKAVKEDFLYQPLE